MYRIQIDSNNSARYDYSPDFCPVCHHAAEIKIFSSQPHFCTTENGTKLMQLIFRCPRQKCGTQFIVEYRQAVDMAGGGLYYSMNKIFPRQTKPVEIAEGVDAISPKFKIILQQTAEAESRNLTEITGMGYRKALEFLIKDYCIDRHPDKAEEVKKTMLGACIEKFVTDRNITECAKRAVWLGNDETHYERIWTTHDISDLKILIKLTQGWISSEFLTRKYMAEMDKTTAPTTKPASK